MKSLLKISFAAITCGLFFTSCKDDDDYQTIESVDKVKIDSVKIVNDTMDVFRFRVSERIQHIHRDAKVFTGMTTFTCRILKGILQPISLQQTVRVHKQFIPERIRLISDLKKWEHTLSNSGTEIITGSQKQL